MHHDLSRGYASALVAVAACWLVLSWPWLSGQVTIPYDAKAHFFPQLQFLAKALHSGQSPFWTPNVFAGSPQVADPQSLIFSPAILIAYFNPDPSFRALDAYTFALLLAGALAIVMLFRDRRWHPAGATVAALAFAFGGSAAWRLQHIKQVQSFVFFAVALWLLSRALDKGGIRRGILAGFAVTLMIVEAGQVAMLGAYVLAAHVVWHWFAQDRKVSAVRASFAPLIACGVTVAVFATLPVLMTMEFISASNRIDIPFEAAGRGSLHPGSLITTLIGDVFSAAGRSTFLNRKVDYWGPPSPRWNPDNLAVAHNMCQIYSGSLVGLACLAIGIVRGALWRPDIRFYTVILISMTLYALGWYTPGFRWFYDHVPFVHLFRRPADATFLMGAILSIVGGYLVHVVASGEALPWRQGLRAAQVLVAVFAVAVALAIWKGHVRDAIEPLLLSGLLVGASALVLALLPSLGPVSPTPAVVIVAVLMTVDLMLINGANGATALPPAQYAMLKTPANEPTIEFLKARLGDNHDPARRDRVELAGLGFEWPNTGMIHEFDHVLGYNPLRLAAVSNGIGAGDTIAIPVQRRFTPLFPSYSSPLARMLGLRFIASTVPIETIDRLLQPGDVKLVATTSSARIYETQHALPRVLFAGEHRTAPFAQILTTGHWPEFDPRRTVLLDGPDVPAPPLLTAAVEQRGTAALTRYENTTVEIEASSPAAGFVVLNDIWHPWWRATVDGRPVPILKANVMFRAVAVSEGRHVVRFEFAPFSGVIDDIMRGVRKAPAPERTPGGAMAQPLR